MATAVAQQPTSSYAVPSALRDLPFADLPPLRRVNADDARYSDAVHERDDRLHERRESSTVAADAAAQVPLVFSDAAYAPQTFDGSPSCDAERWLRHFKYYAEFRQLSDAAKIQLFQLMLTDSAADWLDSVPSDEKCSSDILFHSFTERFVTKDILRWRYAKEMFNRVQSDSESVDQFVTDIVNIAKKVPISDPALVRVALLNGFKPYIRRHVLEASVDTLEETIKVARITEAAYNDTRPDETEVDALTKDVRDLIAAVQELQSNARPPTQENTATVDENSSQSVRSTVTADDDHQRRADTVSHPHAAASSSRTSRPLIQNLPQNWDGPTDPFSWQQNRMFNNNNVNTRFGPQVASNQYFSRSNRRFVHFCHNCNCVHDSGVRCSRSYSHSFCHP
ncbi:MAG TPA: hypothetical protein VLS45_08100, partial [Methylomicrobium sp.]|nr:hypothetical protein [Methylomicrobium sp.]